MNEPMGLRTFIGKYSRLPDTEWDIIRKAFIHRELMKNEILLEPGKVCRHFWFLEEGLIRFFILKDGLDITKTFTIAPYCFTAKASFRHQQSSQEGIQALERSIVWQMEHDRLTELSALYVWNDFLRNLTGEVQEFTEMIWMDTRIETAETRYKKMLDKYPPALIQKIPLRHIASFLGIAPQSLSRIRKKLHDSRNKLT